MNQGVTLNLAHFKSSIAAAFPAAKRDADRGQLLAEQVAILAGAADLLSVNFAAAVQSQNAPREWLRLSFYLASIHRFGWVGDVRSGEARLGGGARVAGEL